jgi:hypothetical protein
MRGAIPPLSQYAFIALKLKKHRDNCTFAHWIGGCQSAMEKRKKSLILPVVHPVAYSLY